MMGQAQKFKPNEVLRVTEHSRGRTAKDTVPETTIETVTAVKISDLNYSRTQSKVRRNYH